MSATPAPSSDRAAALAAFDQARDAYLAAFSQAPDEALAYVPAGEEYTLGVLTLHLCDPIERYLYTFECIRAANFGLVDLASDAEHQAREASRHAERVAARPTGADRPALLRALDEAHQRVHATAAALDGDSFTRQAPVIYSAGAAPYPTSFRDILGWLTDHYHEHTTQVAELLDRWRGQGV